MATSRAASAGHRISTGTSAPAETSNAASLRQGIHHITAAATDNGGLRGATTVTLSVVPPSSLEFAPKADAYVDSGFPTQNFGTDPGLIVDATAERISYLRFQVSGVGTRTVTRALLRLKVDAASSSAATTAVSSRRSATTRGVSPRHLTNRPTLDGTALSELARSPSTRWSTSTSPRP
jgi:hypothetical protein